MRRTRFSDRFGISDTPCVHHNTLKERPLFVRNSNPPRNVMLIQNGIRHIRSDQTHPFSNKIVSALDYSHIGLSKTAVLTFLRKAT